MHPNHLVVVTTGNEIIAQEETDTDEPTEDRGVGLQRPLIERVITVCAKSALANERLARSRGFLNGSLNNAAKEHL